MIKIQLFRYNNEKNALVKTEQMLVTQHGRLPIVKSQEYSGLLYENCDVLSPVISLEFETFTELDYAAFTSFNYAYIDVFKRYYFIENIETVSDSIYRVHLKVDVLHTYRNLIRAQKGVISRNQNLYDAYIPDEKISLSTKRDISIKKFREYISPEAGYIDYDMSRLLKTFLQLF